MLRIIVSSIVSLIMCSTLNGQGTQLLRQPTISNDYIVFVYANDLWKVAKKGGDAIRLTTNIGYETTPHFSPDEQWIAFTAEYDGNIDVYVIPSVGGEPKRMTWHPGADVVQGWTPDGAILFRSSREAHPTQTAKFYTVSLLGGMPIAWDIPRAAHGEISPDGRYTAYVPMMAWDPEWRNYRGGQAMPIWIVDNTTKDLIRTPQPTKERHLDPVWLGEKVYYLSERDLASNIWMFDPQTKEERQITFHKRYDVKSLDASTTEIVYEQGGYLHLLDPLSGNTQQLNINVIGDMNYARIRWESVSGSDLRNAHISPNGKRAIFEYRGEILSFPKEHGTWRNLTNSPGTADRFPIWSPKGDRVAWFSDESGEYQLQIADQKGEIQKKIALPNPTFYFTPDWSPDGKHIAYTDTDYNIWIVNIETANTQKVDADRYAHPNRSMNPVWSPDSKWIAYARRLETQFSAAFAYHIDTHEKIQLTDGMADVMTPVWDQSGKYLYFLASTDYGLKTGWLDMSSYDPDVSRSLYCLLLSDEEQTPLELKSDEEEVKKADDKDEDSKEEGQAVQKSQPTKNAKKQENVKEESESDSLNIKINKEGLSKRIVAIDIPSRNYIGLLKGPENTVFILESIPHQQGADILKYDLKKLEKKAFVSDVTDAVTSWDGNQILFQKGGGWKLVSAASVPSGSEDALAMNAKIKIDPQAEYQQIFKEGWRFMRDFLYVDNVHGAPWDDIYAWYAPWIDHVRHRRDLNYVVDIMSGEVSIGHSFVYGGDMPDVDHIPVGLLGCDFQEEGGFYQFGKIFTGENWNPNLSAPLHIPGAQLNEGDYLLAVNGVELAAPTNPYSLFEQTSGRITELTVNDKPTMKGSKQILVKPVSSDRLLRSWNWVEENRRKVDELSGGQLAYVYVPNTGGGGFTYFNRYYFAQQDKQGVVIDERNNGGGSAADYMIDIMGRTLMGYFNSKSYDRKPWTTPMAGIWGPKVMIINERSGSGGDLLPYMFRVKELGPLVGTRTWGGLVGTWDTPRFIDGGGMVAPRGGFFDLNGEWAVEGEGVAPDIEVIQDPKSVSSGHDPQLEAAVNEAMRLLKESPVILQSEPAPPIRWMRPDGYKNDREK